MNRNEENIKLTFQYGTEIELPAGGGNWDKTSQMQHIGAYLKNGIEIKKGDVVFDVGANMGLFSAMVFDQCDGDVTVYAFEVIKETFQILDNIFHQLAGKRLHANHMGISNQEGSKEFMFYPNAPGLSTRYYDDLAKSMEQMVENIGDDTEELPDFFGDRKEISEEKNPRFQKLRAIYSLKKVFEGRLSEEKVVTLSKFISEYHVEQIDLLKIDVNGSELDVCMGISENDWKKIRQIVIEVPVRGSRIDQIKEILNQNGFENVVVECQDAVINKGLVYALVYASKKKGN